MKRFKWLLAIFLVPFASGSFAAQGAYVAIGAGLLEFDDGADSIEPRQLLFRIGYDINDYFGFGYENGFSIVEDEAFGVDFDVDTKLIYLRARLPVSDTGSLYVIGGKSDIEVTGSFAGLSISTDDDDTGIGFGFETQSGNSRFFVDYIKYYDQDGADVVSLNFGGALVF